MPFRVANAAVHALNALLLFALLRRLQIPGAWVAAALWAVHPVNVESVAWITELKNTQSFLFFLLCLYCYLRHDETRHAGWYALALLAGTAAFTSKPSTVTLPAILLLAVWWRRRQWQWRDVWPTVPFFAMAAGMSLLTIAEQYRHVVGSGVSEWSLSLTQRTIVASRALWFYAGQLLLPVNVMFVYPRWTIRPDSVVAWLPLAALILVIGVLVWRRSTVLFGLGFFVLALLPVLGLFDIYYFRFSFVADHFNYIGSAGFLALVAAGVARLPQPRIMAAASIGALTVLGWQHAHAFRSDGQLWADTLKKNPMTFIAHNNLAGVLKEQGQAAAAISHWHEALRLCPTCWEPWMGLGKMYRDTGEFALALECFTRAQQIRPDFVDARYGLGMTYFALGRWAEAREQLERAARQQPHEGKVQLWLGDIAMQQSQTNDAIRFYLVAIRDDPAFTDAYLKLGRLRRLRGENDRAISCYEAVLRLRPGDGEAQSALTALRADAGRS